MAEGNNDYGRSVPLALALVFCDAIYNDPVTRKRSMLGCFSSIQSQSFPCTYPGLAIYAALTEGYGKENLIFKLVDADENREPVFEQQIEVEFVDPRAIIEMQIMQAGVTFTHPGEYRLQVLCRSAIVVERRLVAVGPQPEGPQQ